MNKVYFINFVILFSNKVSKLRKLYKIVTNYIFVYDLHKFNISNDDNQFYLSVTTRPGASCRAAKHSYSKSVLAIAN